MRHNIRIAITFLAVFFLLITACNKDNEVIDKEYPVIDISGADAFPIQCSTLKRGESFTFKARFTDNVALGSFSIDVHHNFDHHSHSTEVDECDLQTKKTPVNPFLFIKSYEIPSTATNTYEANVEIAIPADVDPGDYHFMINVTDQSGWNTMKGLSIKID